MSIPRYLKFIIFCDIYPSTSSLHLIGSLDVTFFFSDYRQLCDIVLQLVKVIGLTSISAKNTAFMEQLATVTFLSRIPYPVKFLNLLFLEVDKVLILVLTNIGYSV